MNIEKNVNLKQYNTFQFPCIVDSFVAITSTEQFCELLSQEEYKNAKKKLYLWWWSNILLTKDRFEWLVIKNEILWKEIINENDTAVTLRIWWWENRDAFVQRSIEQWYCWIENLISIPWSVWAAPMQNIWAYGVEVQSVIDSVEYIDSESWKSIKTLENDQCKFCYRHSIFKETLKGKAFITHVTITLQKYNPETYTPHIKYWAIQERLSTHSWPITPTLVAETIASIRESKLPNRQTLWTAWSFFKNPVLPNDVAEEILAKHDNLVSYPSIPWHTKLSAWQLIDLAWCKWINKWTVWTYEKHALVLIHKWWGKWEEIVRLANEIIETVKGKFWVTLTPEVNYIL